MDQVEYTDDLVNWGLETVPVSFRWPNPATGHLQIEVRWGRIHEQWECVGLGIDFAPGAWPIRSLRRSDLDLKMSDLLDHAASLLADAIRDYFYSVPPRELAPERLREVIADYMRERGERLGKPPLTEEQMATFAEAIRAEFGPATEQIVLARRYTETIPKRPGHPPVPLATLQEAARVYSDAYKSGRDPTKAVWEHFQEQDPDIKRSRVGRWVMKARENGLLPPTTHGRARGLEPRKPKEDKS